MNACSVCYGTGITITGQLCTACDTLTKRFRECCNHDCNQGRNCPSNDPTTELEYTKNLIEAYRLALGACHTLIDSQAAEIEKLHNQLMELTKDE